MPNVAALLKEEITRLSRKEVRRQLAGMKKASAQYRRHIAALRRQIDRPRATGIGSADTRARARIRGTSGDGCDADAIRGEEVSAPTVPVSASPRRTTAGWSA